MAGGPGLEIPVSKFETKLWRSLLSNWCLLAFALILAQQLFALLNSFCGFHEGQKIIETVLFWIDVER